MKHGQGSCATAEAYLLGEKDAKGEFRSGVKVLKGDMHITAQLADALEFKNKYTSLVIAWHPFDKPTNHEIEDVLSAFVGLAFAGLESCQYNLTAVLHVEMNGSRHVHIIIPRVELQTANSMNIVPPNYRGFNYLCDYLNESKGWRSPDISSPNYSGSGTGSNIWGSRKELKNVIDALVADAVEMGLIDGQEDVIAHINSVSGVECIRSGENFITIKTSDLTKGMRLKSAQYRRGYDFQNDRDAKRAEISEECRLPISSRERIAELKERLEESTSRRVQYNQSRYTGISGINVGAFSIDERYFVEINRGIKERHAQSFKKQQKRDAPSMVEDGTYPDSNGSGFISDLGVDQLEGACLSDAEEYANINFYGWEPVVEFRQASDSEKRGETGYSLSANQVKECKGDKEKQASVFERASQYIIERFERTGKSARKAIEYFNEASKYLNLAGRDIKQESDREGKNAKINDRLCDEVGNIIQQTDRVNDIITELTQQEQTVETDSGVTQVAASSQSDFQAT